MSDLPRVLVYAPFSFNGQGPAESCASIVDGFSPLAIKTELFVARIRNHIPRNVDLHQSLPLAKRHLPWRMVNRQALSKLDEDFKLALRTADPANTIAYFWPDPAVELVQEARRRGIVTVREMINTACATSGPILDAAYARLGLPQTHPVSKDKIVTETRELRSYDFFFASNPEVEKSLQQLDVKPGQILRTTFGWTPGRLLKSTASSRAGGGTRFVFVGALSVRKGIPELLDAWHEAKVEGELLLAGRSSPDIASLLHHHKSNARIRILGYVKDVGPLFRSADVFVFPTLEEGGPQVTYEAAGCGLPVITTAMGAARLVETGITGVVVDSGSVAQLTEAIRLLGARDDLRVAYGERARRRAADFVYSKVGLQRCGQLLSILEEHRRHEAQP